MADQGAKRAKSPLVPRQILACVRCAGEIWFLVESYQVPMDDEPIEALVLECGDCGHRAVVTSDDLDRPLAPNADAT